MNTNNRKKWNKKEDQVLLELVNVCGEHWADLTRAYNQICDQRTIDAIQGRWNKLNPSVDHSQMSPSDLVQLWQLYKLYIDDWSYVRQHFPNRIKSDVQRALKLFVRKKLQLINRLFGQNKQSNQHKLSTLSKIVYNDIIKLSRFTSTTNDQMLDSVIQSCKVIVNLLDIVIQNEDSNDETFYDQISQLITKEQLQTIFEHVFLMQSCHKIAKQNFKPSIFASKRTINDKYRTALAKTWEEAQQLVPNQQFVQPKLSEQEMKHLTNSKLFQNLSIVPKFKSLYKYYMDIYHEALKTQQQEQDKYTVVFQESKKPSKKSITQPRQQMNKMKPLFKRLKKEKIPLAPQTVFESALMDELNI